MCVMYRHFGRSSLPLMIPLMLLLLVSAKQVLPTFGYEVAQLRWPPCCVPSLVARGPFRSVERSMRVAAIAPEAVQVLHEQWV